jgi:hypothetical protein
MFKRLSKRFSIGPYALAAFALIAFAIIVRVILVAYHWPLTDSDEGTMGLEAMHIAFRGAHPIYLYGQNYMGVIEAYVGAAFFHLFGVSLFTLRLGMIFLFTLFLIGFYLLSSLLYTKRLALVSLALLSVGAMNIILPELRAVGGALETLLFGTLSLLLTTWLALTAQPEQRERLRGWRFLAYGGWGLVVGLGLWSHLLVAPFVLAGMVILLVFCWREWRTWAIPCILLGFLIGGFPPIYYNLTAPPGQNSLDVVRTIESASNTGVPLSHAPLIKRIVATLLYSLPIASGFSPICNLQDLPMYGPANSSTALCSIAQGGWSLGYLALLLIAIVMSAALLWKTWRAHKAVDAGSSTGAAAQEAYRTMVIQVARLMLAGCAVLTILLYVDSPLSAEKPWSTRYLIGLLIALPVVIWPLWRGIERAIPVRKLSRFWLACRCALILLIGFVYLAGMIGIVQTVPAAQTTYQHDQQLVHDLEQRGIVRFYSDYWTCDRLAFLSQERIICSVVDINLHPGLNRYTPYMAIVAADSRAPYVFLTGSFTDAADHNPALSHYQRTVVDGYVVYAPQ